MTISKEQASSALLDLKRTQDRSSSLYKYAKASPHLALWGCVWMLAYGLNDAFPSNAGRVWLIADSVGAMLSIYIALVHQKAAYGDGRVAGSIFALAAFAISVCCILPPHSGKQVSALIPMIVAVVYVQFGIWHGRRFLVTGSLIAASTMFGFYFSQNHFNLWMAVVGGGALMLTSAWLKRA